jgi:hypothetical protein
VIILCFTLFVGVGAVAGSIMFFADPINGFLMPGVLDSMRQKLPFGDILFKNLIFAGISLLIVNGLTNLAASYLIIKDKRVGYILGSIFGITLMAWIGIQFYVFAPTVWPVDIVFFLIGFFQFVFGYASYVYFMQASFVFNESDYPDIKDNGECIVIYFSRMGYTKKKAYMMANEKKCRALPIISKEKTDGLLGYWWSGRFGMHRWGMAIEPLSIDVSKYKKVYIVTSAWVFHMSSPAREFLKENKDKLNEVDFTLVHFMDSHLSIARKEAKSILGDKLVSFSETRSHFGRLKDLKKRGD